MPDTRPQPAPPPPPTSPSDELESRLDALGFVLTDRESKEPSVAMLAAVRGRARRTTLGRWGAPVALAATLALAALVYVTTRPVSPTIAPPIVSNPAPIAPAQSFAALRHLNRDATPETLRLPSSSTSAAHVDPGALTHPRSGGDPESIADLLGSSR